MKSLKIYLGFFSDAIFPIPGLPLLICLAILCSLVAVLLEAVGVLMFLPLLELLSSGGFKSENILLAKVSDLFADVELQQRIFILAAFILFISLSKALFEFLSNYLIHSVNTQLACRLSGRAFSNYFRSDVLFAEASPPGQTVSKISGLPQRVAGILNQTVALFVSLIMVLIYIGLMLLISIKLTILALFLVVLSLLVSMLVSRLQSEHGRNVTEHSLGIASMATRYVQNFRTVKLFNKAQEATELAAEGFGRLGALQRKVHAINSTGQPTLTAMGGLFISATLVIGGVLYIGDPQEWVVQLILFLLILYRLMGPVAQINNARLSILSNISAIDTFLEFEGAISKNAMRNGELESKGVEDCIVFDLVDYTYPEDGARHAALRDINLKVSKSEMVGLVGKSGSGKTTIAFLLGRMMDPTSGRVLIDGVDLKDFKQESWLQHLAYVSQSVQLLPGTIAENLRVAAPNCTEQEMDDALQKAGLKEFINGLPKGVHSDLGEYSGKLSSGQAQRLMIARALIMKPSIIVLDEPTSHLDNITTEIIRNVINELKGTVTLLLISHNIQNLQQADKIILLADGEVVATGSHSELTKSNALYKEFVEKESQTTEFSK